MILLVFVVWRTFQRPKTAAPRCSWVDWQATRARWFGAMAMPGLHSTARHAVATGAWTGGRGLALRRAARATRSTVLHCCMLERASTPSPKCGRRRQQAWSEVRSLTSSCNVSGPAACARLKNGASSSLWSFKRLHMQQLSRRILPLRPASPHSEWTRAICRHSCRRSQKAILLSLPLLVGYSPLRF